jgi:hypothetical protein
MEVAWQRKPRRKYIRELNRLVRKTESPEKKAVRLQYLRDNAKIHW